MSSAWPHPLPGFAHAPVDPGRAAALPHPSAGAAGAAPVGGKLGFGLFILVNAVLFIRPAEVVPDLEKAPIYEVVILACLAVSLPSVLEQLSPAALSGRPITVCVLGLLAAVMLSHLSHFSPGAAYDAGFAFAKVVVYYLLLVGLVNTPGRLRCFLLWLVGFVVVLTLLALLQYHGVIS